jgi:hypothetical protein
MANDRTTGLTEKYAVARHDGKPLKDGAIVMEWGDPNARVGIAAYSRAVREDGYEALADDLDNRLAHYGYPQLEPAGPNAAVAAIAFALRTEEGMDFLECWNEGNFEAIRREWPDAPEDVFIGADPLYRPKADDKETDHE